MRNLNLADCDAEFPPRPFGLRLGRVNDESPPAGARTQMRLELRRQLSFERAQFIVSDRNRDAVAAVDSWPDWPGGRLALIGPEGSGKSHLASAWATRTDAFVAGEAALDLARLPVGPILLEDVDRGGMADDALFHLINRADAGGSLLMTARTPPRLWATELPDLRSRLNALFAVEIGPPDDALLEALLMRFFRDRHIRPDPDLLSYLLRRMERSATAAQALVARLDEASDASRRPVTRALAREILGADDRTDDVFE
jgi:chromosomal replication initiation ATPase DnaA